MINPIFLFLGILFNSGQMNQLPAGNWKEEDTVILIKGDSPLILQIFKLGKAFLLSLLMGAINHLPEIFPLREQ